MLTHLDLEKLQTKIIKMLKTTTIKRIKTIIITTRVKRKQMNLKPLMIRLIKKKRYLKPPPRINQMNLKLLEPKGTKLIKKLRQMQAQRRTTPPKRKER